MPNTKRKAAISVPKVLDRLEAFYGPQTASWPSDPYLFLLWWHCGYPPSEASCTKGWTELSSEIGTGLEQVLSARTASLVSVLKAGGLFPELRAKRIKEVASRIKNEFDGDLRTGLLGPIATARKILKSFPGIAEPGANRILLFAGIQPVAAVPSNCAVVLQRIRSGKEEKNYNTGYREVQRMLEAEVATSFDARIRAYLLLQRHGQELCKRTHPKCPQCPIREVCAFVE